MGREKPDTRPMREQLEAAMEPTEVQTLILKTLRANAGKPVTTRLATVVEKALQSLGEGDYGVRLVRNYGMTTLEYGDYARTGGRQGGSLLLSHKTTSEPIAERYLADLDKWLVAKHERNDERRKMLATDVPEKIDAIKASLLADKAAYARMHDVGGRWQILPSFDSLVRDTLDL